MIEETVFGQIKFNPGFRRFYLGEWDKVPIEFTLACLTYKIKHLKIEGAEGEGSELLGDLLVAKVKNLRSVKRSSCWTSSCYAGGAEVSPPHWQGLSHGRKELSWELSLL